MQRIAVVTGGGSGIGAAAAQALAEDGWTVVLAGRRKEALETVVSSGAGLTGVLDAIPTDVTDEASVLHGKPAPRRECCNDDLDGNEDAVHRPRLSI